MKTVNIKLCDNYLHASLDADDSDLRLYTYAYYVYKDGVVIKKEWYSNAKAYKYYIEEDGQYRVSIFCKQKDEKTSNPEIFNSEYITIKNGKIFDPNNIQYLIYTHLCSSININSKKLLMSADANMNSDFVLFDLLSFYKEGSIDICAAYNFIDNIIQTVSINNIVLFKTFISNTVKEKGKIITYKNSFSDINYELKKYYKDICAKYKIVHIITMPINTYSKKNVAEISEYMICDETSKYLHDKILELCEDVDFIPYYTVELNTNENKLVANVSIKDENYKYLYYFLRYGVVVHRTEWTTKTQDSFEMKETGVYTVQAYVRKNNNKRIALSLPKQYITIEDKKKFKDFMSKDIFPSGEAMDIPRLFTYEYPNTLFGVVQSNNSSLGKIKDHYKGISEDLNYYVHDNNRIILSKSSIDTIGGKQYVFSGFLQSREGFYFGKEQMEEEQYKELKGSMGQYTFMEIDQGSIYVGKDFFSISRLFYYMNEDYSIVTNDYHMLLRIIKTLGIEVKLDITKARVNLSTCRLQPLSQNYSNDMDIIGAKQCPLDHHMIFDKRGLHLIKNEMHNYMTEEIDVFSLNYADMIETSKHDIICNSRNVISNDMFNNIIVDLSGGLDSRVVYSAITNIEDSRENIVINSKDVPGCNDLKVALEINSLYNYKYDVLPRTVTPKSFSEIDSDFRSYYMGQYYDYGLLTSKIVHDTITLNGFFGEIILRDYYTRKFFGSELVVYSEQNDIDKFVNYLFGDYGSYFMYESDETVELIKKEILSMNGSSLLEKYENMYMSYRNSYHCNGSMRGVYAGHECSPIQSKSLYTLHRAVSRYDHSPKLQFDIIHELNNVVSFLAYESEVDNISYKECYDRLLCNEVKYKNINLNASAHKAEWQTAQEIKFSNRKLINSEVKQFNDSQSGQIIYNDLMYNLQMLLKLQPELLDIGDMIYYYINSIKDQRRTIKIIYNRIVSLLDQIKIVT